MTAVFRKEFKSSLLGMTGPIFIFAVLVILGFFTMTYQFRYASSHFEYAIVDGAFWSLLLTPILTMRSFSEERRTKTDQLLYSLPITTTEIVLGKYLAMVAVFAIPCAVTCLYPLIASLYSAGDMNFGVCYGAIGAYFLLGCAVIAIGMLFSSLFESQVICAIINLAALLLLYFIKTGISMVPDESWLTLILFIMIALGIAVILYFATKNYIVSGVAGVLLIGAAVTVYIIEPSLYVGLDKDIISALYIFQPITAFATGVIDLTCYVYYLSICAIFAFITVQSFESRRWN